MVDPYRGQIFVFVRTYTHEKYEKYANITNICQSTTRFVRHINIITMYLYDNNTSMDAAIIILIKIIDV